MASFEVFSGGTFVGTTMLEHGDPPMGVAFGQFFPSAGYQAIQSECVANRADQTHLKLTVRTPADQTIQCVAVGILDYSHEVGAEGIEINVLGITYPPYEELFPQHVERYEQQFESHLDPEGD